MCKVYGYVRISTMKQSLERQIRNIKELYPDAIIVNDEYTGKKMDRPGWMKLYKTVKSGATIVFDEVSRMSRDAEEGFRVYEDLYNRGVNLIFIKEPHISTSVYRQQLENQIKKIEIETGKEAIDKCLSGIMDAVSGLIMDLAREQIKLAFEQAESEIKFNSQRTSEGIETARLNGKQIGQVKGAKLTTKKSVAAKKIIVSRSKSFCGTLDDDEVIKLAGISRNTFYKYKRELYNGEV